MAPGDIPESFGQYLKRERELREIGLEEIASYTRIKLRALRAIEMDDFASLPPLAFVRAFVRCYADYIGLSLPDVMLRFNAFVLTRYPELTGEAPLIKGEKPPRQRYILALLLVVVALLAILAYWMTRQPIAIPAAPLTVSHPAPLPGGPGGALPPTSQVLNLHGATPATAPRAGETVAPAPGGTAATMPYDGGTAAPITGATLTPSPDEGTTAQPGTTALPGVTAQAGNSAAPAPAPGPAVETEPLGPPTSLFPAAAESKHQVVIVVKTQCWVGYTIDGKTRNEILLSPGQTFELEANASLRLKIGNPNAVASLTHNGKDVAWKPLCSPQLINFPAEPKDKPCVVPRPAAPAHRPATPAPRPAAPRPVNP